MKKLIKTGILLICILIQFTCILNAQSSKSTKYDIGFILRGYDSSQLFEDTTSFGPYARKILAYLKDLSFGKISTYRIYMNGIDPRSPVYMQSLIDIETLKASLDGWPGSKWDWLRNRTGFWYVVPDFYKPIIIKAIDWMNINKKDYSYWMIESVDGKLYGDIIRSNTIRMGPSSAQDYLFNLKLPIDYKIDENKVAFFALNTAGKDYILGGGAAHGLQAFGVLNSNGQPLPKWEWVNGIEINRYSSLYCATDYGTLGGLSFYYIAVHELIHAFGMGTHDEDPDNKNKAYSVMNTGGSPAVLKTLPAWNRYFWTKWLPKSTITTNPSEISDLKGKVSPSDTIRKYILQIVAGDDKGCGGTYKELYDGKWYKYTVNNIGTLTFIEGINNDYYGVPIIEVNPFSQTVFDGKQILLSVYCSGDYSWNNELTYVWKKNGVIIPGAINSLYVINSAKKSDEGNYQVTISNTFGSVTSEIAKITINALPASSGLISGESTICPGQKLITYTALPINSAISYIWTLPTGATGTSNTNIINVNYDLSAVSGNITVRGHNSYGDGAITTLPIIINPLPSIPGAILGASSVCFGQNTVLYSVPVVANATSYIWTLPTGATGTSTTNTITVNFGPSAVSGNITVKGHNNCGDGSISTLAITVNPLPTNSGTITGISTVCQGQNAVTYSVPVITNATSYIWTLPTGSTGTSAINTITVNFGTSAVSGNITVKGNNTCGNGVVSTLPITVNPIPVTPIITQNGKVLSSNTTSGNQWYNLNNPISGSTNQDYTITAVGEYTVQVTLKGCVSAPSNMIKDVVTSIPSFDSNEKIKVYPNPVSDNLTIEYKGNTDEVKYEIYSSTGQLITTGVLLETTVVYASTFPSGLYTIKFNTGNKFEFRKVIKHN